MLSILIQPKVIQLSGWHCNCISWLKQGTVSTWKMQRNEEKSYFYKNNISTFHRPLRSKFLNQIEQWFLTYYDRGHLD